MSFYERSECGRIRCLELEGLACDRMAEGKTKSMEANATNRVRTVVISLNGAAILVVAHNGVMKVLHVDTYLILATSLQLEFHQRVAILAFHGSIVRDGIFPTIVNDAGIGDKHFVVGEP